MTAPTPPARRSLKIPVIAAVAVLVIAVGAAGWYFFIRDDAPDAFDIDTAAGDAGSDDDETTGETPTTDFDGDVSGTWTIDPTAGADAGGPSAGFRVDEELANIGANTVVGRTPGVEGSLTIDDTTVTAVDVTVDMTGLETDDSRRDGRMHSSLGTDDFPTATFALTEPIELGEVPVEGETISVNAVGDLTIRDVTMNVGVDLDARLVDGVLVLVGSTPVVFEDYGVEKPTAAIVVSLEDDGLIEFQLFFTKQS